MTNDEIVLHGLNRRGKNRIREHGNTFRVIKHITSGIALEGVLVECLCEKRHRLGEPWWGWFDLGVEVEVEK